MRDSLTILAILLVCLLTAALVGPYFIDWNGNRGLIEARLSEASGTRIAIAGPIKVRLLPQPKFQLGQVTIGDRTAGQRSFTADELDVDIALTALMRGDLQIGEVLLHAPRLDLAADADGIFRWTLPGGGDPARVQINHVSVVDGTVSLARPQRPTLTMSGLDFDGEATSLLGPFRATGRFGPDDDPHGFRLSTGVFEGGKIRLKLALEATRTLPALDFDGMGTAGDATSPTPAKPRLSGLMTLKGEIPLDRNPAVVPWLLTGHVEADEGKATSADLELRAGTDLRALDATGTGELSLGADPHAALRLRGPQLDVDRLAVAPDKSSVVAPKGIDLLLRLKERFDQREASALPLRLDADYGFETVTVGPVTLPGLAGQVGLDGGRMARVRLTVHGPDTASVTLDGSFEGGTAPVFRGRLEANARDLPRLATWLAPVLPDVSAWAKASLPARGIGFEGNVDLSGVGVAARDAVLRLDGSEVKGTMTYTRAVGSDHARLFADLASEGLDLDELPDLGATAGAWTDVDLDVTLAARAVKVVPAGVGTVDAGRIGLRLHKVADKTVLDALSADLGSARLTATASLDAHSAMLDAHVDAPQLDAVTGLLGRVFPGAPAAWLSARAPALSPARLDLDLRAARGSDGSLLPTGLTLDGTMNGSRVKATLDPDTPGDLDPTTALFTVDLDAAALQGSVLLRQLGFPAALSGADPSLGAGRLKGRAHGSAAEGFEASLDASLGGAVLSFQGRAKPDQGNGHLRLQGSDLSGLLRSGGVMLSEGGAARPADADADLAWHDTTLAFRRLHGTVGGTAFSGDLDATLTAPAGAKPVAAVADKPTLFGTLLLDRLQMSTVLDVTLGSAPREAGAAPPLPWSSKPFGPPLVQWPRSAVAIKVKALDLRDGLEARDASFTLRAARGALTLADFTGKLEKGNLGGSLTLRRDEAAAVISGVASWSGIGADWPGLSGRTGGTLDFGGSGDTPSALVASLAGTGSVTVADGRIARLDPAALVHVASNAGQITSEIDNDQIMQKVVPELDRAPLRLGDVSGQATLAGGVFRLGPMHPASGDWTADVDAALDLKDFGFSSKTVLRLRQPLAEWKGEPPQVTLSLSGPIAAPQRDVDAAAFVNALQLRAIARDQERIDIIQQDIRERAFFNRRLKAIEAEQSAARANADASATVQRQMRQNQESPRDGAPSPPPRPTGLPGAKPPSPSSRANRPAAPKPAPSSGPPIPHGSLDPSSAGRY